MSSAVEDFSVGIGRLRPSVTVLVVILVCTLTSEFVISELVIQAWKLPVNGHAWDEDNWRRVDDGDQWLKDNEGSISTKKLTVIMGTSAMREAVSVDAFNRVHGKHWNVMGLCGVGPVIPQVSYNWQLLSSSRLKADHIVIGMWPRDLLEYREQVEVQGSSEKPPLEVSNLLQRARAHRTQIALRTDRALIQLRHLVHGLGIDNRPTVRQAHGHMEIDPDDHNPFREVLHLASSVPERICDQMHSEQYSTAGVSELGIEFADMLRSMLTQGIHVTIIFVPQHSTLRSNTSGEVREYCKDFLLKQSTGSSGLRVVDLHDRLSDEDFGDRAHVGKWGRRNSVALLTPYIVPQNIHDLQ